MTTLAFDVVRDGALGVADACEFTGLGRSYLFALMSRGQLRFVKVGKRRLIPKRELERLLAEGLSEPVGVR